MSKQWEKLAENEKDTLTDFQAYFKGHLHWLQTLFTFAEIFMWTNNLDFK